jgi:REP element-mobilizing transposase RayT
MSDTFTQLYVHTVFAVKGRVSLISPKWKSDMYKYVTGIVKAKGQKLMIINGMPDHVHMLIGFRPDCTISHLMRDVKACSSKWINDQRLVQGRFEWQLGYGAFTVSKSDVPMITNYIIAQEEHHRITTFREEYVRMLRLNGISFKNEYLFEEVMG